MSLTLPAALVLGPPRYVGPLGVMRSLGRLGVRVYGLKHRRLSAANASRFCAGTFDVGDDGRPTSDPLQDLAALINAGKIVGQGSVLIPGSDEWAFFMAENAPALAEHFRFHHLAPALVRGLATKSGLHKLAMAHGFPTPAIALPRSYVDATEIAARLRYPVFIKPVYSRPRGQWLTMAKDASELLADYLSRNDDPDDPNVMFQEFIPGEDKDVWMYDGYFDGESRCLAAFTGQKIRQHPAHMGHTSFGICRFNADLIESTNRFLTEVGYKGLVDIGFRYDNRDGQYKVLDINPRVGGNFRQFVDVNGLDVVRALYYDLTARPVPSVVFAEGRRWVKEDSDLVAFVHYRRQDGLTVRQWLRSLRGVEEGATFTRTDPLPFFISMLYLFNQTVSRRLQRRIATLATGIKRLFSGREVAGSGAAA